VEFARMLATLVDFGKIVVADIVLSGDNALIIGMAAASLAPELRRKAILFGMIVAAVLRIIFAVVATKMLAIPGLLLIGSVLLFWVCWSLYKEIKENVDARAAEALYIAGDPEQGYVGKPRKTIVQALITITIADISMSIDNVLAVAAIADGNERMLVFGLAFAILLMAFAATLVMKILTRHPWISWLGLGVLIYVAAEMAYRGVFHPNNGILAFINGFGS
jgi:YjbE family integral membrane protein